MRSEEELFGGGWDSFTRREWEWLEAREMPLSRLIALVVRDKVR